METSDGQVAPTVLVVEDEWVVRASVAGYLRECGYRVLEAGNADEAITALRSGFQVDVVFSDVQMPGSMDGWVLARWVRRERPAVRVIMTSGIGHTAEDVGELCSDGPLVAKPYSHVELERRIRKLLAER